VTRTAGRTLRVGLLADSHVGEFLDEMPAWVEESLVGCDLILHAGDLSVTDVLARLEAIAPVWAVRGDHDVDADALPESLVVAAAGWRIGLVHGIWSRPWDATAVARTLVTGDRTWQPRLESELCQRLGAVDAVVYGHWHVPRIARAGSTLMVCPGAVCPGGALGPGNPLPRSIHAPIDVAVRSFRRRMHPDQHRPAIAVLDVGSSGIRARHIFDPATGTD
jgi:putative phosphoesterase